MAKILIVEDSMTTAQLISARIKAAGYTTIIADGGQAGLDKMRSEKPDLVILDVLMPDMDGFEVCRIAKIDPDIRHIPIVFVTTAVQEEDRKKGKLAGGAGYITKPYTGEELVAEIRKHLKE